MEYKMDGNKIILGNYSRKQLIQIYKASRPSRTRIFVQDFKT